MKKRLKAPNIAATIIFALLLTGAASCRQVQNPEPVPRGDAGTHAGVLEAARQVVEAFKAKDGARLAQFVHPEKGVRFSPSAYVDVATDIVFFRSQFSQFWTDPTTYTWGVADGTGDPINMTPGDYFARYIMDRDFFHPSFISVNNDRGSGNTVNNAASVYPNGTRIEYYLEPPPGKGVAEFDWAALRFVFEERDDSWFLVAVIHDEWTT